MEQIMKLPVDTGKVVLSEDYKSILRNLFSGCRVNFCLVLAFLQICWGHLIIMRLFFKFSIMDHA